MRGKNWILLGLLIMANLLIGMVTLAQTLPLPNTDSSTEYELVEDDIMLPVEVARGRATYQATLWTGGIVPYVFHSSVDSTNRTRAIAAMAEWESVSGLIFTPRTSQSNYIEIVNSGSVAGLSAGNWSYVGMVGGRQYLSISNWTYKYVIAHELAHAMGFWHEQSRPDRDNYVTIKWQNIPDDKEYNFQIHGSAATVGTYDFASVMHYGAYFFSGNGQPTIVAKPGYEAYQNQMGNQTYLTDKDKAAMGYLYPKSNVVSVPGDSAASAYVVSGSGYTVNIDSTPFGELGEPMPAVCVGSTPVTDTIWFKIPNSANARAAYLSASGYDTVVSVYSGSPSSLSFEGCTDNYTFSGTEIIDVPLDPYNDYYIQVGGWNGSVGTLTFQTFLDPTLIVNGSFERTGSLWTVKSVPSTRKDDKVYLASGVGVHRSRGVAQFKGGSSENSTLKQTRTPATIPGGWTFTAGQTYVFGGYVKSGAVKNKIVLQLTVKYADGTLTVSKLNIIGVQADWTWHEGLLTINRSDVASITMVLNNKSLGGKTLVDNVSVMPYDPARSVGVRGSLPAPDKYAQTSTLLLLPK